MKTPKLTHERLLELLHYDPETGLFTWLVDIRRGRGMSVLVAAAGSVAGSADISGYVRIGIDGELLRAHRLARFYVTGMWPENLIDHRDCDPSNNRYANLRDATYGQNKANSRSYNSTGFKGVVKVGKLYVAQIRTHGERIYLGRYSTAEQAHKVYALAAKDLHGEFARAA